MLREIKFSSSYRSDYFYKLESRCGVIGPKIIDIFKAFDAFWGRGGTHFIRALWKPNNNAEFSNPVLRHCLLSGLKL